MVALADASGCTGVARRVSEGTEVGLAFRAGRGYGARMSTHVGTSGFSYPEWKGTFYPFKFPNKQMLGYYADRFATVEINNTFYRTPAVAQLDAWAEQVPPHFRFVLKAPQEITHKKKLRGADALAGQFAEAATHLGPRLGALLFQLPPFLKKDVPLLSDFLGALPAGARVAMEFRHASWFADDALALLRERGAALCVADADTELEVPFDATADWGYLRLRRAEYTDPDLALWAERIRARKWSEAFVFFKHEDAGTGPRFAARLRELLSGAPAELRRAA
jgi:uncharacterized protein YecE (DUF72 family)